MGNSTRTRFSSVLILSAAALAFSPPSQAAEETPDWWQAERDVSTALTQPETSLAALVKQAGEMKPTSGQQVLRRISVFTRAGMTQEAIQALRDLKQLCPNLANSVLSNAYHDLFDHRHAVEVAQAMVEIFADNVSGVTLENRLIRHFLETGWSIDRVDGWLADKPRGIGNFWIKERLRFNQRHGRGAALEQELANQVRANPSATKALAYLDAIADAPRKPGLDLAWIAETVKPETAGDAREIASRLKGLRDLKSAIVFYRQAIAMPLTADEVQRASHRSQVMISETTIRAYFAVQMREELAECLLKVGQAEEAQQQMLEAAEIRATNQLGRNAMLAGRVQSESGRRDVEGQIRAEEKVSADSPPYWRERAHYYRGRKEPAQEEEAIKKGLALTTPQPLPDRAAGKGNQDWRSQLLGDYVHFLHRHKREREAVQLLRMEISASPAAAVSAVQAARMLAFDFEKYLDVDDAVLWSWLENKPRWEHVEERMLWRMLERANRNGLERHLARAEKLALGGDPSRAQALGWIENRMQFPQRSLALLDYAIANSAAEDLKQRASFTLLESCLDIGDWQRAEKAWPLANHQLTAPEFPEWYAKIAVAAATSGAKADAMRIWIRVANFDLTSTRPVEQLVKAGLRDELTAFYQEIQRTIPTSKIPPEMLAKLQRR